MSHGDQWRRRLAIQIVSELPEDADEALRVLAYAKELVEKFVIADRHMNGNQEAAVLPFPAVSSASISARRASKEPGILPGSPS